MIKTGLKWSGLLLLLTLLASAVAWFQIPGDAAITVLWNRVWDVNQHAGKLGALFLMPAIIACVIILFAVLPFIEPRKKNLKKSASLWLAGWIGCSAVFAITHFLVLYGAVTGIPASEKVVPVLVSFVFIVVGNYMSKSRSNWSAVSPSLGR